MPTIFPNFGGYNLKLNSLKKYYYFLICLILSIQSNAQCISIFPYNENFETSVGGWTTGGTNNDWTWGIPSKPIITSAGQGLKCWVTGGLIGSNYNNAERSWIQSPCFDFTNLPHPYIEFKIFWESERKFDGGNLQYSTNNGSSWTNVGTINTPVDCYNDNWYNYNNITYLTTLATIKEGWCGNIQSTSGGCQGGFGSNGWKTAKHCLNNLAGLPNVIFRFTFGAGTSCNSFDGLGIDDIYIKNAPRFTSNFGYKCTTTSTFSFTDSSTNCPTVWNWNFGDIASGTSNTSSLQNPSHIFSAPGIYQVQLIATNTCSGSDTSIKTISVLGITIDSTNVTCPNGSNGKAKAIIVGGNSSTTFAWNTSPIQHIDSIINLIAGTYQVSVSSNNTCSIIANVHIKKPNIFSHSFVTTASICSSLNGAATINISGGTPTYSYSWSPNVSSSNIASNISTGNYLVTISDSKNCIDTMHVFVPNSGGTMALSVINKKNVSCFGGNDGAATINVTGGTPNLTYSWAPNVGNSASQNNLSATIYTIVVTDTNHCSSQIQTIISQPTVLSKSHQIIDAKCGLKNGNIQLQINGGTKPYQYSWSGSVNNSNIANQLSAGNYFILVTDSHNCKIGDTVIVKSSTPLKLSSQSINDSCNKSVGKIFTQIISGTAPILYSWKNYTSTNSYLENLKSNNTYTLFASDSNQCHDTIKATIAPLGLFNINIGNDTFVCNAQQPLILSVNNYQSITWQDGTTKNNFVVVKGGEYSVAVKNSYGCIASDTIFIDEKCNDVVLMPNSFTPNQDGIDDEFGGITNSPEGLKLYQISIYNRWGQLVFASNDYYQKWNGNFNNEQQPNGVFVYVVEYSFDNKNNSILLKGDVTLLR
ncbi:MAG: hypothetical protein RL065_1069 [Bacteroidota bacterium]